MKLNRNDRKEELGAYGTMIIIGAIILVTILKLFGAI
jgi:hypothetical protein